MTALADHEATDRPTAAAKPGWRGYAKSLGPGLVTGASDDDPSGIATYAQSGAQFQYGLVWAALVTWPLMSAVQEICDRTALTTGKGLGELIRARFSPRTRVAVGVLLGALMLANVLNMAADLVAIGQGMHLLHAGPATLWAVIAGAAITGARRVGFVHDDRERLQGPLHLAPRVRDRPRGVQGRVG